jgi:competence protein ComEC
LKFLWTLLTVSIAAQLATFPLGLFYFNQFPNYFWLSNFVVIPGATIIIWLTFAFFIATPLPFISALLAKILHFTTGLMLHVLKTLSELPYSVNEGIVIKKPEVFILYGIIIFILIFGLSKRKQGLFLAMALTISLQVSQLVTKYQLINQKKVFAYNSPGLLIHLINGRTNYLITNGSDTLTQTDKDIVQRVVSHLKLNEPVILNRQSSGELNFKDLKVYYGNFQFLNCRIKFNARTSFINQRAELYTLELKLSNQDTTTTRKTIFSGNSYFTKDKDTTNFYLTRLKGAYFLSLN